VIARYGFLLPLPGALSSGQEVVDSRHALDLAAIEQLHKRDAAAAKKGDAAALADLWTDDAVALPPGEPPVIGIEAIRKWLAKSRPDASAVEVVDYVLDFKEVTILGVEAIGGGPKQYYTPAKRRTVHDSGIRQSHARSEEAGRWELEGIPLCLEPRTPGSGETVSPRRLSSG
jgi:uncharacterized protein (TIGR02246 family)